MRSGELVSHYMLGPQIGQGAFGSIFAARDTENGLVYAFKTETSTAERKTLSFEQKVMVRVQDNPYVPRLFDHGEKDSYSWVVMELIGPSLNSILKSMQSHHFSVSTGLRTALHSFIAIRKLHEDGFLHRDIKPANILVRISKNPIPICICDFGLVRLYRDQKTGQLLKKRERAGFRGTKTYASLNAHMQKDLSRCDDLISWFYFVIDICGNDLPWKGVSSTTDVAIMKNNFDVATAVHDFAPSFIQIWDHIKALKFEDEPNYDMIEDIIQKEIEAHGINEDDPYDWEEYIQRYHGLLVDDFGVQLRLGASMNTGMGARPYVSELGVPKQIMKYSMKGSPANMRTPLLRRGDYSTMQVSELNEQADRCCC